MKVGAPKEIKNHEYRVGLTPSAAQAARPRATPPSAAPPETSRDSRTVWRISVRFVAPIALETAISTLRSLSVAR